MVRALNACVFLLSHSRASGAIVSVCWHDAKDGPLCRGPPGPSQPQYCRHHISSEITCWAWGFDWDGRIDSSKRKPSFFYDLAVTCKFAATVCAQRGSEYSDTHTFTMVEGEKGRENPAPVKLVASCLNIDLVQSPLRQEEALSTNVCNKSQECGFRTVTL